MPEVIKTIRGRKYRYFQTSQRVGGKVKTTSHYIAPVHPKRKKAGTVGAILGQLLQGGVQIGAWAVVGKLGPPGGKAYRDPHRPPDQRTMAHQRETWEQFARNDPKAAIADIQARAAKAAAKETPAPINPNMLDFRHHIDAVQREQAISRAEKAAAAPSPAPAAGEQAPPSEQSPTYAPDSGPAS